MPWIWFRIRRYCYENEEFILVDTIRPKVLRPGRTTKPAGTWDWAFYESEHGKEATGQFHRVVEEITARVKA